MKGLGSKEREFGCREWSRDDRVGVRRDARRLESASRCETVILRGKGLPCGNNQHERKLVLGPVVKIVVFEKEIESVEGWNVGSGGSGTFETGRGAVRT